MKNVIVDKEKQNRLFSIFFMVFFARYCELYNKREKDWLIFSVKRSQPLLCENLGPTFFYARRFHSLPQKTNRLITSACRVGGRNISLSSDSTPAQKLSNPCFFFNPFNYGCFVLDIWRLSALFFFFFSISNYVSIA